TSPTREMGMMTIRLVISYNKHRFEAWPSVLAGRGRGLGRPGWSDMPKLEYRTLNDRAYSALKKGLISGQFKPGQVLTIRQLAQRYGISATPVREALQRLVAEGALGMLRNRSVAVPGLTREKLLDLRHIRCLLEGHAGE